MKTRNVRARQKRRYRQRHYDYRLRHHADLLLPWSAYGYNFTAEQKIEIKRLARFFR